MRSNQTTETRLLVLIRQSSLVADQDELVAVLGNGGTRGMGDWAASLVL